MNSTQPTVWLVETQTNPTITADQTFSSEILEMKDTGMKKVQVTART